MLYRICANPNCTRAGQALPLTEFYRNRVGKKVYYKAICKVCTCTANTARHHQNMQNSEYRERRRVSALKSYHKRKGTGK